jgi:hypothetical protein
MELPADEEDDEEMMSVPELLVAFLLPLLDRVPHHDAKSGCHDPSRQSWTRREVDGEEGDEFPSERRRGGVGEECKVDHVTDDAKIYLCQTEGTKGRGRDVLDDGEDDDGPTDGLVYAGRQSRSRSVLVLLTKCNSLGERNHAVQWPATKETDQVATDGK